MLLGLARLLFASAVAVTLGFAWTGGQGGLMQTNSTLCGLWSSLHLPAYPTCASQFVLPAVWALSFTAAILWLAIELYRLAPALILLAGRTVTKAGTTTGKLSIVVSAIPAGWFLSNARLNWFEKHYTGNVLEAEDDPNDAEVLSFGYLTITNTSRTERVMLDIVLHLDGPQLRLSQPATLEDRRGSVYGRDDIESMALLGLEMETQKLFRNPVGLDPQESQRAGLAFVFDFGDPDLRSRTAAALSQPDMKMTLEIADRISGYKLKIPIPREYSA